MSLTGIEQEIFSLGRPASWYQAVVTSETNADFVLRLYQLLPEVQSVLVIQGPSCAPYKGPLGQGGATVVKAGGESLGYSAAAYLAVMQFLLSSHVSLDHTLFFAPNADQAIVRALQDLRWFQSRMITRLLEKTQNFRPMTFMDWTGLLLKSHEPMQALEFVHLMSIRQGRDKVARLALAALLEMDCADDLTLGWINFMPVEKSIRKRMARDVQKAMVQAKARGKSLLEANLESLGKHHEDMAEEILKSTPMENICSASLPQAPWLIDIETGIIDRAPYPLLFQRSDGLLPIVNSPADPRGLISRQYLPKYKSQAPGVIFGSLRSFDSLINIGMNKLEPNMVNMDQPLYIVERDPSLARLILGTVDLTSILEQDRVMCFFGADAVEKFTRIFQTNSRLLLPAMTVSVDRDISQSISSIADQRIAALDGYRSKWQELYPEDFSDRVCDILQNGQIDELKILLVTSLFSTVVQYVTADMAEAFTSLGADTRITMERNGNERCDAREVAKDIYEYRPHLVMILDHIRPEYQGLLPENLPWIAWNQDPLAALFDRSNISRLGPCDFSYTVSSLWSKQFASLGYPHMEILPFAANTRTYHAEPENTCQNDEVAFITNMESIEDFFPAYPGLQTKLVRMFDERDITYADTTKMSRLILDALGSHPGEESLAALVNVATWRLERWYDRRRVLRWLLDAKVPVGLYGLGWEKDPEFRSMARGWVKQGDELAKLYRSSKAVLHVNTLINTHQRVFECISSGGFVLARRTPYDELDGEIHSCLEPGREIELFGSAKELSEKLHRVLQDSKWRSEIIAAGQDKVLQKHTYIARARAILDDVGARLSKRKARAA